MVINYKHCPHCDAELTVDTEIYVQAGDIIGCENCVRQTWADFDDYEDDLEDEFYDDLYDEMKMERVFG